MGKVSPSPLAGALFTPCSQCTKPAPTHNRLVRDQECWYRGKLRAVQAGHGPGCTEGKKPEV